jgi:hypothetical protein
VDRDHQLRADVVSALEAVAPPAPWLASTIVESLRAHPRRGGRTMLAPAGFRPRGLLPALAVALVLLLLATAVGIFAVRSFQHPVPAHRAESDVVRYAAALTRDKQRLDEAAGYTVLVGGNADGCDVFRDSGCADRLRLLQGGYQWFLDDLDHMTPPTRFAGEHARMQTDLQALIFVIRSAVLGYELTTFTVQPRDELLTIEAYVVYESTKVGPVRDTATAAYTAMVERDYDNLHLPTVLTTLLLCREAQLSWDSPCTGSVATTRGAIQAFLADLQANPQPARFATIQGPLVTSLEAELRSLDEVDKAAAAGGFGVIGSTTMTPSDRALFEAVRVAVAGLSSISTNADGILYAHA